MTDVVLVKGRSAQGPDSCFSFSIWEDFSQLDLKEEPRALEHKEKLDALNPVIPWPQILARVLFLAWPPPAHL